MAGGRQGRRRWGRGEPASDGRERADREPSGWPSVDGADDGEADHWLGPLRAVGSVVPPRPDRSDTPDDPGQIWRPSRPERVRQAPSASPPVRVAPGESVVLQGTVAPPSRRPEAGGPIIHGQEVAAPGAQDPAAHPAGARGQIDAAAQDPAVPERRGRSAQGTPASHGPSVSHNHPVSPSGHGPRDVRGSTSGGRLPPSGGPWPRSEDGPDTAPLPAVSGGNLDVPDHGRPRDRQGARAQWPQERLGEPQPGPERARPGFPPGRAEGRDAPAGRPGRVPRQAGGPAAVPPPGAGGRYIGYRRSDPPDPSPGNSGRRGPGVAPGGPGGPGVTSGGPVRERTDWGWNGRRGPGPGGVHDRTPGAPAGNWPPRPADGRDPGADRAVYGGDPARYDYSAEPGYRARGGYEPPATPGYGARNERPPGGYGAGYRDAGYQYGSGDYWRQDGPDWGMPGPHRRRESGPGYVGGLPRRRRADGYADDDGYAPPAGYPGEFGSGNAGGYGARSAGPYSDGAGEGGPVHAAGLDRDFRPGGWRGDFDGYPRPAVPPPHAEHGHVSGTGYDPRGPGWDRQDFRPAGPGTRQWRPAPAGRDHSDEYVEGRPVRRGPAVGPRGDYRDMGQRYGPADVRWPDRRGTYPEPGEAVWYDADGRLSAEYPVARGPGPVARGFGREAEGWPGGYPDSQQRYRAAASPRFADAIAARRYVVGQLAADGELDNEAGGAAPSVVPAPDADGRMVSAKPPARRLALPAAGSDGTSASASRSAELPGDSHEPTAGGQASADSAGAVPGADAAAPDSAVPYSAVPDSVVPYAAASAAAVMPAAPVPYTAAGPGAPDGCEDETAPLPVIASPRSAAPRSDQTRGNGVQSGPDGHGWEPAAGLGQPPAIPESGSLVEGPHGGPAPAVRWSPESVRPAQSAESRLAEPVSGSRSASPGHDVIQSGPDLSSSDASEPSADWSAATKLDQLKDLYLTAEAIGDDALARHFAQVSERQRQLIREYFDEAAERLPQDRQLQ